MKSTLKNIGGRAVVVTLAMSLVVALGAAIALSLSPGLMRSADAAVQNYGPGVGVYAMPIHLTGPYTVSGTVATRFKLPYAGRLIGFSAAAETVSGTITVDLKAAGVSLLSAPVALTAATVTEGVVTTSAVADEAELTGVVYITGGGATVSAITILPTFLRR